MNKYALLIYEQTEDPDNVLTDIIGPFAETEDAYLYVDQIREGLNSKGVTWSYSVWDLTIPSESSNESV